MPRHGFSLAAYKNYIYAFGGFTFSPDHSPKWKSVSIIERYDIAANTWTVVANLDRPRSSNVVARVGSKVYIMAGWDSTPKKEKDFEGTFLDSIEVFDLETEQTSLSDIKIPNPLRRALSSVVIGDEILLVGGLGVGASHFELLDKVTAFNTKTLTWRELPKLPFATFAPATGFMNNQLFVLGGMYKTGPMDYVYVNHIYTLNLEKKENSWQHLGRHLSQAKGFSQVVNLSQDVLGILGGHTYEGDEDHPVASFETLKFSPATVK